MVDMDGFKSTMKAMRTEMALNVGRARNLGRYATRQLPEVEVGQSPHRVVLDVAGTVLLDYHPQSPVTHATPILFVPSLVNRHYILDLIPERSVVGYVQKKGYKTYLLDWGVPGLGDSKTTLSNYVEERLDLAVSTIIHQEGVAPTLVGYCMGGSLALLYAARFPRKVRNLVLLATPVDFSEAGLLRVWSQPDNFNLGLFVDANGLVPPDVLNHAFTMLKPSWQARNLYSLIKFGWNDDFLRSFRAISKWVNDPVPVAGEAFREYVQHGYRDNRFMASRFPLDGTDVDLGQVTCPALNIIADADHIVPPPASRPLPDLLQGSPDAANLELPVGHIGLSVGQGAFSTVWKQILAWLAPRSAQ